MAGITLVSRVCRSCRGQAAFGKNAVGGVSSSLPTLALLGEVASRLLAQPALQMRAGLSGLMPWRFLGHQPADGSALGLPW
jgi:hypothetical protein